MTTGMKGFSEDGDWDFAAGSVYGFRSWTMEVSNPGPELSEVSFRVTGHWGGHWSSAVQEASCRYAMTQNWIENPDARLCNSPHESVPSENCGCGFWAYWEAHEPLGCIYPHRQLSAEYHKIEAAPYDTAQYTGVDDVNWIRDLNEAWYKCPIAGLDVPLKGIIEGFGRTIIGERGFRCQKAVIKNLAIPEPIIGGGFIASKQTQVRAEIEELIGVSVIDLVSYGLTQAGIDVPLESSINNLAAAYASYRSTK
jgi:hypothetical protein